MSSSSTPDSGFAEIARLLKANRMTEGQARILDLVRSGIPRTELFRAANFARQAQSSLLAIRLLGPHVRPPGEKPGREPASNEERAVYAAALIDLGAVREALKLLASVDKRSFPQAEIYEISALLKLWEFERALPLISRVIPNRERSSYSRLWALQQHALVSLLSRNEAESARGSVELLGAEAEETELRSFFRKSALNLHTLLAIRRRDWREALALVRRSARLQETDPDAQFGAIADQWRALIPLARAGRSAPPGLGPLRSVRRRIVLQNKSSNLLLHDYFVGVFGRRPGELIRGVFGIPYEGTQRAFHSALLELGASLPPSFEHWLAPRAPGAVTIEAATGVNDRGKAFLKEGQVVQRLFQALAANRYASLPLAELHETVFAGEYFSPKPSADRMHQAFRRLRAWLGQSRIPLEVVERHGFYSLRATGPCAVRLERPPALSGPLGQPPLRTRVRRLLDVLERRFGAREFSVSQAAGALSLSTDSALLHLREAIKTGLAERRGTGPGTRYCFRKGPDFPAHREREKRR